MIKLTGLNKYFNKGKQNQIHVINDVSLDLPESGMVAIFGRSGCGKTTLLNVIGGLDGYSSGAVSVEGRNIKTNTDDIRNRYIGYIFQNYNLNKNATCYDNIADALRLLGMKDGEEMEKRVDAALRNVGMDKFKKRLPDTLSGGQQQRIAIARAIVKNPRIILADEPTGNLDEANTIMVMDLLKQISRDHLVLLVTHESKLVDYYCDTVVELSDGKVHSVKRNDGANGYAAKDKNAIYLGEYEKSEIGDDRTQIEYYGERPAAPIKLKIINEAGKFYVKVDTASVNYIDEYSEIKLYEGVYEEKPMQNSVSADIDMSALPPIEAKRPGRLFGFWGSVKSGYAANFKRGKGYAGKLALRTVMMLFSAVLVLMTSLFGTSIGQIVNARNSYNHNVFYVLTENAEVSGKINAALASKEHGIDSVYMTQGYQDGSSKINFQLGFFETFDASYESKSFGANAVYLDLNDLATNLSLVAGKNEDLLPEEVLITRAVADSLIEKSTLGYIEEYSDLIGLVSNERLSDGKSMRIAGIVDSAERAVYLSSAVLAERSLSNNYNISVNMADKYSVTLPSESGKLVYVRYDYDYSDYEIEAGDIVMINGIPLEVSEARVIAATYSSWVNTKYPELFDSDAYFKQKMKEVYPNLTEDTPEYQEIFWDTSNRYYFDFRENLYSRVDEWIEETYVFTNNFHAWLYAEKNVDIAKYCLIGDDEYYSAVEYKKNHGVYPELNMGFTVYSPLSDLYENELNIYDYEMQFYKGEQNNSYQNRYFLVSEKDYVDIARCVGPTSYLVTASSGVRPTDGLKDIKVTYNGKEVTAKNVIDYELSYTYTVIHSNNPAATEEWILNEFSDIEAPEYMSAVITPSLIFSSLMIENMQSVITGIISMAVVIAIMSVCMYFIMRSSLMSRVKEIGIYRAIGVSRKNLIFRFGVESVLLTTLTVLVGFILMSGFVRMCISSSVLFETVFYYPMWMAGALLVLIYALCIVCGVLPLILLIRKTPSAILSKYDI